MSDATEAGILEALGTNSPRGFLAVEFDMDIALASGGQAGRFLGSVLR